MKHNLVHSKVVEYSIVYRSKQKVANFYLLQFQSSLRRTFLDFHSILGFENQNFAATLEILNLIMIGRTLWTWAHLPTNVEDNMDKSWLHEGDAVENVHRLKISGHQPGSFIKINSGARFPHTVQHNIDSLDLIRKLAKPEAKITIVQAVGNGNGLISASKLVNQMKLAGLITVQEPKTLQSLSSDQLKTIREILSIPDADIFEIGKIQI